MRDLIARLAARASEGADIVIAEGAMGLFDGAPGGAAGIGASADIAALLGWPVVLVHDVSGQGQTAAAIVRGIAAHDARVKVAGVVLNRVGSERHRRLAGEAIEALGIPVFGALPRNEAVALPERHLGLVQAGETPGLDGRLEALADFVEAHVDVAAMSLRDDRRNRRCHSRRFAGAKRSGIQHDDRRAYRGSGFPIARYAGVGNDRRRGAPASRPAHRDCARRRFFLLLSASRAELARRRRGALLLLAARR